jgi:hypothetical protein
MLKFVTGSDVLKLFRDFQIGSRAFFPEADYDPRDPAQAMIGANTALLISISVLKSLVQKGILTEDDAVKIIKEAIKDIK